MMAKRSDIFTDGPKGQRVIKTLYGDVHEHSPEAKEIARQMTLEKERRTKRLVFKNARTEARARAARLRAQARAEKKQRERAFRKPGVSTSEQRLGMSLQTSA